MAKHKSRKPGHRATPVLQKASASGLDEAAPPDVQTPLEDNHAADGLQLVQDITQAVLDGTFTLPVHGPSSDSSADSSTPTQSATRTDPTQEEDFLPIRETVPEAPVPEAAAPEAAAPEAAAPEAAAPEADGSESEDVEAKAQSGEGETGSGDVAVSPDDLDDEVFKSAQAPADSSVPTVGNVPGFLDRGAPEVVSEEGSAAPVLGEGGRADTSVVEQKGSLGMVPRMVQEFDLEKWDKEKRAFEDRISQLLIADGQARMDISNLEAQLAAIKSESEQTAKEVMLLTKDKAKLQEDLEQASREAEALKREMEKQSAATRSESEQAEKEVMSLTKDKAKLQEDLEQASREAEALKREMEKQSAATRSESEQAEKEVRLLTKDKAKLQEDLEQASREAESLKQEIAVVKEEVETLKAERLNNSSRLMELDAHERELVAKRNDIDQSKRQVDMRATELDRTRQELDMRATELDRLQKELDARDAELTREEDRLKKLERLMLGEKETLLADRDKLLEEKEELATQKQDLMDEQTNTKRNHDDLLKRMAKLDELVSFDALDELWSGFLEEGSTADLEVLRAVRSVIHKLSVESQASVNREKEKEVELRKALNVAEESLKRTEESMDRVRESLKDAEESASNFKTRYEQEKALHKSAVQALASFEKDTSGEETKEAYQQALLGQKQEFERAKEMLEKRLSGSRRAIIELETENGRKGLKLQELEAIIEQQRQSIEDYEEQNQRKKGWFW